MEPNYRPVNEEDQEFEIDILELLGVIVSKIWIVILAAAIAAAGTYFFYAFLVTPMYRSTTKIYVINRQNGDSLTYTDLQTGSQLTKDYQQLVTSRPVLEQVKDELGLNIDENALKGKITVSVPTDTRIVSITVEDADPYMARAIADRVRIAAAKHIANVMNTEAVNVVEEANLPTSISSPKTMKNTAIGGMVGAAIAIMIIVLVYILDDTIKNPDDIEKYLHLSVLASIPLLDEEILKRSSKRSADPEYTSHETHVVATESLSDVSGTPKDAGQSKSSKTSADGHNQITINKKITLDFRLSEAFKTLRTNIDFCGQDVKAIALTSCFPGEGKSSVSFNLAISMVEAGKRVLFIDGDMRKSVLNGRYQMSKATCGLAHYLAGRKTLVECIYTTNIPNLFLIPTGAVPPNPAELLGVKRFKHAMETLRQQFDYIIIDTPPLGSVIDSAIVAKQCDGVVVVIETKTVSHGFAERVIDQLHKAECNILGVVLNKVDIASKYYGKYYGQYYGQYYGK